ncbi:uncharacterized protein LOC117300236 [Asterias rubens]|uniref:uncharacterized protein LOC117300236 n=1 Tax=Asterias rubens TaxID=7604 RepID=UPI001455A1A4|nr:uncharacterized protein LOC117300236 [Asterias rubens]
MPLTVRRRHSPPNLRSPCVLRRSWTQLTSGGNISRSPSSVSVQGSSLSKGKRPGTSKKTKNPATRAVTKKNKAGKGNPVPGSSTPAAMPPTGLLRKEGVPPPRVSVRHSPSSPTESPSVAMVGDGVEFADRNPAAHAIGLGALAVGRQIAHAEPANWGSPGILRSVGPSSSSGFTRCSGIAMTQPVSEGTSEVTPALSSRRGKKAKKGNRSRRSSSSSDSSRESRRGKRHRGDSLSRADFMEAFQALTATLAGREECLRNSTSPNHLIVHPRGASALFFRKNNNHGDVGRSVE